jgi:hypothetical protein
LNGLVRQIFVGLSNIYRSMGISTIFAETAHFFVLVELAFLSFVVVVGDIEQFELHFNWKGVHLRKEVI